MLQVGICLITAALVAVDQLTKWLAVANLKGADPFVIISGFFSFTYTENTGAAWNLFDGQQWLLIGATSIMLLGLLIVLLSGMFKNFKAVIVGGVLVVAGGIGNLIDRIFRGYVVDFIRVDFIDFPIFNFADCLVVIGAIWLFIYFVFIYSESDKKLKSHQTAEKESASEPDNDQTDSAASGDET